MNSCNENPLMNHDFTSWKWQYAHRLTTAKQIGDFLNLSEHERYDIQQCLKQFRMAVTPYYAGLINPKDPFDPIKKQAVPSIEETLYNSNDMDDPLNECKDSPVAHVVHRYPNRVLLLVTFQCAMYCRHCTRRRVVGEEDRSITDRQLNNAVEYIKNNPDIHDVLISGGDPFVLETDRLETIIAALRGVKHVEIIRIGTRVPVVMPMRIDEQLLKMLRKYQPIWINTHFNHPNEITPMSRQACESIVDAGIPLGNQSVLLKGVNDDTRVMAQLLRGLVNMRVRPYYLYQCDLAKGIGHFRTRVESGIEMMHALTGNLSGYSVPKYVIDAPKGGGKIPLGYQYLVHMDEYEVVMENYLGTKYRYPQP